MPDSSHRDATLQMLCDRRTDLAKRFATCGVTTAQPWFASTIGGLRHFVFPALPPSFDEITRTTVCQRWLEQELVSRGMVVNLTLFDDGPIFSCSTRKIRKDGFGKLVKEWGSPALLDELQASFRTAVNAVLERQGLPQSF